MTPHFTIEELTRSQTATRKGIDNTPDAKAKANLQRLAESLEKVRALLGHPMVISSGYRSPAVNKAVGGSTTSAHCKGLAADFDCPAYGDVLAVCKAIAASGIEFDQLIYEGGRNGWVHFGLSEGKPRQQVLTWTKKTGYRNGIIDL